MQVQASFTTMYFKTRKFLSSAIDQLLCKSMKRAHQACNVPTKFSLDRYWPTIYSQLRIFQAKRIFAMWHNFRNTARSQLSFELPVMPRDQTRMRVDGSWEAPVCVFVRFSRTDNYSLPNNTCNDASWSYMITITVWLLFLFSYAH